ncbi:MAG: glycosyltransferase family 4 protein [Rhizomicrobium sp.]
MRIGIDAHVLGKGIGGVEQVLRHVVALLPVISSQHDYVIFLNRRAAHNIPFKLAPNALVVPLAISNPLIERSLILPWLVRRHRLDALIVQRLSPWLCGNCKLVLTIHDITPLKFPLQYRGLTNQLIRKLTSSSVRRAQLILTPSQTIADEVKVRFGVDKTPVLPFYNGVDGNHFAPDSGNPRSLRLLEGYGIHKPYILVAGAIEARKNLETIYRSVREVADSVPVQLVLTGLVRDRVYESELANLADSLDLTPCIRKLGFVDADTLLALYQNADVFVTASRDEGFNLPPLEAMACGTPVICSDIPVHRELFNNCARFFTVNSPEALASHILEVLTLPTSSDVLREAARARAASLTWQSTSKRIAAAFEETFAAGATGCHRSLLETGARVRCNRRHQTPN